MVPILAICVCACVGTLMRYGFALWLNPGSPIPYGTLAVNLIGGYLIGVCVAVFNNMPQIDPIWRLALVTGFLGSLTTFSSFSAEVMTMLMQQRYALALGTISVHLFGSLLLTFAGIKTAMYFLTGHAA